MTALATVHRWLAKCPDAYAAVGVQRGPVRLATHVHLLIGGVQRMSETLLRGSWVKRGHVLIERFTPLEGGVRYIVDQSDDIELIGDPVLYRPRQRGRRAGRPRDT